MYAEKNFIAKEGIKKNLTATLELYKMALENDTVGRLHPHS